MNDLDQQFIQILQEHPELADFAIQIASDLLRKSLIQSEAV